LESSDSVLSLVPNIYRLAYSFDSVTGYMEIAITVLIPLPDTLTTEYGYCQL